MIKYIYIYIAFIWNIEYFKNENAFKIRSKTKWFFGETAESFFIHSFVQLSHTNEHWTKSFLNALHRSLTVYLHLLTRVLCELLLLWWPLLRILYVPSLTCTLMYGYICDLFGPAVVLLVITVFLITSLYIVVYLLWTSNDLQSTIKFK